MMLLDGELKVIVASGSLCGAFDIDPATVSSDARTWGVERAAAHVPAKANGVRIGWPGLGTDIVEALVRQLHAEINIAAGGTTVSISHPPELRVVKLDRVLRNDICEMLVGTAY